MVHNVQEKAHGAVVYWCRGVELQKCPGAVVYECFGVLVLWCTGAEVYWNKGVLEKRYSRPGVLVL